MAAPHPKKRAISDRLKGMRFMKRREENSLREKLLEEQKQRAKEAHWTTEVNAQEGQTKPVVLIEEGVCAEPVSGRHGRQSFGKFNHVFEQDAAPTLESPPNVNQSTAKQSGTHHQPEDIKPYKEEPELAAGLTRPEASRVEKDSVVHRRGDLQGPSRTIFKKKKKRILDHVKSHKRSGLPVKHHRNPH